MEPRKIKTALEIALERAERLGAISEEELRRQEDEKHLLIGKGLADRYLVGLPLRDVESQIGSYPNPTAVKRSFLAALADAVGIADSARAKGAIEAILRFAPGEQVKSIAAQIEELQGRYLRSRDSDLLACREGIASEATRLLGEMGIAGSAVRVNFEAQEGWREAQAGLDAAQEERLAPLRQRLKSAVASHQPC
ncbi:MAG: hypothetical protein HYX94_14350 [Chloroflexi bacterium]|nr:hypothetical protein [Chloroflexota bacterium]